MATDAIDEILVLPFFGQGHIFPSVELCKHLSSSTCKPLLLIPSYLSSSVPSSLRRISPLEVIEIPVKPASFLQPPPPPPDSAPPSISPADAGDAIESDAGPRQKQGHNPFRDRHRELGKGIETFLLGRYGDTGITRPICVVTDVMMSWSNDIFMKFNIPIVSFFTSGACSAAMEFAASRVNLTEMKPEEVRNLPGLPEELGLSYSEIRRQQNRPPMGTPPDDAGSPGPRRFDRPGPGNRPPWLDEAEGSTALLINTCDDLECIFIDYISKLTGKPVWGVGPLLPEQYWKAAGSIVHDRDVRSNKYSSHTEDQVKQWLDSKPQRSVLYVSFGSEVGPTLEEYAELASALEEINHPFIWVIQPGSGRRGPPPALFCGQPGSDDIQEGYYPHGLEEKVGKRGLIIRGWAPQLLILSHPSTGGFLSHCGWNSTVEALGHGVPILSWPIRGDQFYNAKFVVSYLKAGLAVASGDESQAEMVKKEDLVRGIDQVMEDVEVHKRVKTLKSKFESGYPASSDASLKSFLEAVRK